MNLLNLEPTKIAKDLSGNSFLIFGNPKSGKSTLAAQYPDPLFLLTEKGLTALPGVYAQPINNWGEFRAIVNELQKDSVRERYQTIVIDTLPNLIEMLDLYIGAQLSDEKKTYRYASDVEFAKGTIRMSKELNEQLQKLARKGYIFVGISHAEEKTHFQTRETMMSTSLDKRSTLIVDRFVDHILFLDNIQLKDGSVERRLYFRGTERFKAGSRFKYVPQYCLATWEVLEKTLLEAIEKQEAETPGSITDKSKSEIEHDLERNVEYNFDALKTEFQELASKLVAEDPSNSARIADIVTAELGPGRKVANLTKAQAELLFVIINNLKEEFKIN